MVYRTPTMDSIDPPHDQRSQSDSDRRMTTHTNTANNWQTNVLYAVGCIGIIYGDIGTSPLYVFSSIFVNELPTPDDVLGSLSLILWLLIIVCTFKYVCLVLRADAEGEGGTFALLTLIRKGIKQFAAEHQIQLTNNETQEQSEEETTNGVTTTRASMIQDEMMTNEDDDRINLTEISIHNQHHFELSKTATSSSINQDADLPDHLSDSDGGSPSSIANRIVGMNSPSSPSHTHSRVFLWFFHRLDGFFTFISFLAAGLLLGDGVLTPAISILSAIEGIVVEEPSWHGAVLPLAFIIIVILFMCQRFGTSKVSMIFSPIMGIWFIVLATTGVINICSNPRVLEALSPYHGITFFIRRGQSAFIQLGAIVLAATGTEAMYADLGHFGRTPVRLSWLCFVLPSLVLVYLGQGAVLLSNPAAIQNTFFLSVPKSLYWPILILATCATIIASQALVSGSFSLISAAIKLNFVPHLELVHTSSGAEGQIYLPSVNYLLMFATLIVVLLFQSSAALAVAYGLAVCWVMFFTTCMYGAVMYLLWRRSLLLVLLWLIPFLVIDLSLLSANMVKVFNGGYLPIIFASVVATTMVTWAWGIQIIDSSRSQLKIEQIKGKSRKRIPLLEYACQTLHDIEPDELELLHCVSNSTRMNGATESTTSQSTFDTITRHQASNSPPQPNKFAPSPAHSSTSTPAQCLSHGVRTIPISIIPCIGIFLSSSESIPHSVWRFLARTHSFPRFIIFLTVKFVSHPYVEQQNRITIRPILTTKLIHYWHHLHQTSMEPEQSQPSIDTTHRPTISHPLQSHAALPAATTPITSPTDGPLGPELLNLCQFEFYRAVVHYGFAENDIKMSNIMNQIFDKFEQIHLAPGTTLTYDSLNEKEINPFESDPNQPNEITSLTHIHRLFRSSSWTDTTTPHSNDENEVYPLTYFLSNEVLVATDTPTRTSATPPLTHHTRSSPDVVPPSTTSNSFLTVPHRCFTFLCGKVRRLLVTMFNTLKLNSDSPVHYFAIPPEEIIEVGAKIRVLTS